MFHTSITCLAFEPGFFFRSPEAAIWLFTWMDFLCRPIVYSQHTVS